MQLMGTPSLDAFVCSFNSQHLGAVMKTPTPVLIGAVAAFLSPNDGRSL
jgi:hypothetical protein